MSSSAAVIGKAVAVASAAAAASTGVLLVGSMTFAIRSSAQAVHYPHSAELPAEQLRHGRPDSPNKICSGCPKQTAPARRVGRGRRWRLTCSLRLSDQGWTSAAPNDATVPA